MLNSRDSGGGMTVTRKKSIQEVKCRLEDNTQDNKVVRRLLLLLNPKGSLQKKKIRLSKCNFKPF